MTVQGMQDMVQENLRSVMGLLQRREEGLAQVVDDRIKCPKRPNQSLHSWRPMGIGNFIQRSLRDIQNQCVEGMWEQTGWLLL